MNDRMKAASLLALAGVVLRKRGEPGPLADECEQQALRLLPVEPTLKVPTPRDEPVTEFDLPDLQIPTFARLEAGLT